jgi:hypothetical protein
LVTVCVRIFGEDKVSSVDKELSSTHETHVDETTDREHLLSGDTISTTPQSPVSVISLILSDVNPFQVKWSFPNKMYSKHCKHAHGYTLLIMPFVSNCGHVTAEKYSDFGGGKKK